LAELVMASHSGMTTNEFQNRYGLARYSAPSALQATIH
jgi:hypothetical protein